MAILCDVQHRRLTFRGVTRLSLVGSWSPPSTYQGSGVRQSYGVRKAFWEPCSVARRAASATISDFRIRDLGWCDALSLTSFVLSFGVGRAFRFALLAYLASVFGRRSVARAWSAHTLLLLRLSAFCWCASACCRALHSGNLNRIHLSVCSSSALRFRPTQDVKPRTKQNVI